MSLCQIYPIFVWACIGGGALIAWMIGAPVPYGAFWGMVVGMAPLLLLSIVMAFVELWEELTGR
jgi:hypothetical protein